MIAAVIPMTERNTVLRAELSCDQGTESVQVQVNIRTAEFVGPCGSRRWSGGDVTLYGNISGL